MERRTAPRLIKQLPVRVGHAEFASTNVSETGLQFGCPTMWKLRLQAILDSGVISATIELPDDRTVTFEGKIIYSSEVDDEYLVGVEFTSFQGEDAKVWRSFVSAYVGD